MSKTSQQQWLGINCGNHDAAACILDCNDITNSQIILAERLTRSKHKGGWPWEPLSHLLPSLDIENLKVGVNRYGVSPKHFQDGLNSKYPFYQKMEKLGLDFSKADNTNQVQSFTHHWCHARAVSMVSPWDEAIIVVQDGAGSNWEFFSEQPEFKNFPPGSMPARENTYSVSEDYSVYLFSKGKITTIDKHWQKFWWPKELNIKHGGKPDIISGGLGMFHQTMSLLAFGSARESGKLMGLAPFGEAFPMGDLEQELLSADWSKAWEKRHIDNRAAWEASENFKYYADLAASVQQKFEEITLARLRRLKINFPKVNNLILTGGCALNCVTNMKILEERIFDNVWVPPFPGDESIAFGAAGEIAAQNGVTFNGLSHDKQTSFFGPKKSLASDAQIEETFKEFKITRNDNICELVAKNLFENKLVAWWQGRSECGPRALGHRSILASIDFPELKIYLNKYIKFRENFRPFGCSVTFEDAHKYFEWPQEMDNPFMSFTPKVREKWKARLKDVTHIDSTSRMQTVRSTQDPLYHQLLKEFEKLSGIPVLLNTSLNVMGEPIVESLEDLKRFFQQSKVEYVVVGNYLIAKE